MSDDWGSDPWKGVGASRGPRSTNEGVRIIGAEEAASVGESEGVASRRPADAPRFGDVPDVPGEPRPDLRFPGADPYSVAKPAVSAPPGGGGGRRPAPPPDLDRSFWDEEGPDPGTGPVASIEDDEPRSAPLPHWTDPPSGEVPRFAEDSADDEVDREWATLADGPRWRDQPGDWEEEDFDASMLADRDHRIGALDVEGSQDAPFSFDEPEFTPRAAPMTEDDDLDLEPPPPPRRRRAPSRGGPGGPPRVSGSGGGPGGPRGSGGGSEVTTRVVTGAVAGGVVLLAAGIGPGALVVLLTVVITMAAAELYQAVRIRGYHPATLLGLIATASLVAGVYARGLAAMSLISALLVVFSFLWYMIGVSRVRPTVNVAVTLLPYLYVGFLGSFAALLLKFPRNNGIGLLIGAVLATVAYDAGAYFIGRWVGRRPLAGDISPNKTIEGAIGGTVVALVASMTMVAAIEPWTGTAAFWLAVIVAIAGPLGDLTESTIKRDLGVKDMGALLPGHGGVLDRIDALLFVIPATYYLARILELFG